MEKHDGWIRYTKLKKTEIGKETLDRWDARKDDTHTVVDQSREMLKDFIPNLIECLNNTKKHYDGNFYIQVESKSNVIMPGSETRIFIGRPTCPDAFHDQAVYKYSKADDKLELLWHIPDKDTCWLYMNKPHLVPLEEYKNCVDVHDYYNGKFAIQTYMFNES